VPFANQAALRANAPAIRWYASNAASW
jgi:hypothetical protein